MSSRSRAGAGAGGWTGGAGWAGGSRKSSSSNSGTAVDSGICGATAGTGCGSRGTRNDAASSGSRASMRTDPDGCCAAAKPSRGRRSLTTAGRGTTSTVPATAEMSTVGSTGNRMTPPDLALVEVTHGMNPTSGIDSATTRMDGSSRSAALMATAALRKLSSVTTLKPMSRSALARWGEATTPTTGLVDIHAYARDRAEPRIGDRAQTTSSAGARLKPPRARRA